MSLTQSILQGAVRFTLISLIAYAVWAFGTKLSTTPLYLSIAAVFVVLSGVLLRPLAGPACKLSCFYGVFTCAFLAYAVLWCVGWFGIKGHAGEIMGSATGLAAFCVILLAMLGERNVAGKFLPNWGVLFLFHTLGYVAGGWLYYYAGAYENVSAAIARLGWGLGHGLGFGAGIGYVLFHCRQETKS